MRTILALLLTSFTLFAAEPPLLVGGWKVIPLPADAPTKRKWVVEPISEQEGQVELEMILLPLRNVSGLDKDGKALFAEASAGSVLVKAKAPGRCRVVLKVIGADGFEDRAVSQIITVGAIDPVPPGPDPVPPPGPAPIPVPGLHVLIVFESGELSKLPAAQSGILGARQIREYLNATCPKDSDGKQAAYRFYDKDVDTSADLKVWQDAMKRPRKSIPWCIVSNPDKGGGYEGPLPADTADMLKLLKQYGG